MQVSQGPPSGHWTIVVARPSDVNNGALPPHPESSAIKAIKNPVRKNAPHRPGAGAPVCFMSLPIAPLSSWTTRVYANARRKGSIGRNECLVGRTSARIVGKPKEYSFDVRQRLEPAPQRVSIERCAHASFGINEAALNRDPDARAGQCRIAVGESLFQFPCNRLVI